MSSRKVRHNGQMVKWSSFFSRSKKYKYNKQGQLEEITSTNTLGDDEFKVTGSKSSLRRMADLERNVSLLITKLNTTDGETDSDSDNWDNNINKTTRFKKDVMLGNGSSDDIDVYGHLDIKNGLTIGSTAEGVIHGLFSAGGDLGYADGVFSFTERTDAEVKALFSAGGDLSYSNGQFSFTERTDAEVKALFSAGGDLSYSDGVFSFTETAQDFAFSSLTGKPTTLSGYGITDAMTSTSVNSAITTAINNLVDGAPAALNTLNELAAAIDDNASYASSITSSLAGKVGTSSAQALRASDALTVSNDTITIHKGDGTSESVSISDANTDTLQSIAATNTNATYYPSFVSSTSGAQVGYVDSNMTYNPSTNTLSVANFNGTATYAKYADLAERYAADAPYAEGTVVVFGGEAEVTASTSFAQRSVAGVVSLRPAVAMNSEAGNNETHPYIALQGRVPVKVTGDVKKGDILVASDVAGTATAWTNDDADPRMTAYVGIAIADAVDGFVEVKVGK